MVIGVDPGLARTGIGVISINGGTISCVHHEVVRTSADERLDRRLAKISRSVSAACKAHAPSIGAVEHTFINENPASSLALGQARGAAIAALGVAGISVSEVAPNTVKRTVTGDTLASKALVASMVRSILRIPSSEKLAADASDALAVAISHYSVGHKRMRLRGRGRRHGR